jgi:hypothetical protein
MSFYVYDCVNEGDIQGISSVGGSIGCFDYQSAYRVSIKIEDCYTHGKVNMEEYGALVGNYANKRD